MLQPKYIAQAIKFPAIEFMTDQELMAQRGKELVFDIESLSNYFCIAFKSLETGKVVFFEESPFEQINQQKLYWVVQNCILTGFNSNNFDIPLLWACLGGKNTEVLKQIAQNLIWGIKKVWQLEKEFNFKCFRCNSIDLQQIAPSAATFCSLKHYGARMHSKIIQDMPIDHTSEVTAQNVMDVRLYCINDLDITIDLRKKLDKAIRLRIEMGHAYNSDLRSLSDAQISERVIGEEITELSGFKPERPRIPPGTTYRYQVPAYMKFYTEGLQKLFQEIANTEFVVDANGNVQILENGNVVSATNKWQIKIGRSTYRLGIGGLHSSESKQSHFATENMLILDRDVASYYPAIILNQQLFPKHIGPQFLQTYKNIVDRRLKAKKDKDKTTADSLKICINGCFGKLGSKWSIFYSPDLLIQVTLTGQLSLLMIIEMLEWLGVSVVSANTDGIVCLCPQDRLQVAQEAFAHWEAITGFETEEKRYKSIHSRDINNYIALGLDGSIKAKGTYVNELSMGDIDRECLMKNPNGVICSIAVMEFLRTCKDPLPKTIEETIKSCKDVSKFLFARRVNGGAVKDGEVLGKIVRWYMRKGEFGCIKYKEENAAGSINMVAESMGSYPLMDIRTFPKDIDYDWYIKKAHDILKEVGFYGKEYTQLELF
jgi:hypothetical protein